MDNANQTFRRRAGVARLTASCLALMMLAAACGGGDSSSILDAVNTDDDNNVSAILGGASVGFGEGVDRPDWLESWFELPEGLSISIAVDDPSTGERAIQGIIDGAEAASVTAQQRAMLEAAGYEPLQDSGYFVKPGEPAIEVRARDLEDSTVGYTFERSFEDEQLLRDIYAPVEGTGTLTVSLDGEVSTFQGECKLQSRAGYFTGGDGLNGLEIELRDGQRDYISSSLIDPDADEFVLLTLLQVTDTGEYPTVSINSDGFKLEGFLVDSQFSNPTPVTMDVLCPS